MTTEIPAAAYWGDAETALSDAAQVLVQAGRDAAAADALRITDIYTDVMTGHSDDYLNGFDTAVDVLRGAMHYGITSDQAYQAGREAATRPVLDLHAPYKHPRGREYCSQCDFLTGEQYQVAYPCSTVRAIELARGDQNGAQPRHRDDVTHLIGAALRKRAELDGRHLHHSECIHNLPPTEQVAARGRTVEWWTRVIGPLPEQITPSHWETEPPAVQGGGDRG